MSLTMAELQWLSQRAQNWGPGTIARLNAIHWLLNDISSTWVLPATLVLEKLCVDIWSILLPAFALFTPVYLLSRYPALFKIFYFLTRFHRQLQRRVIGAHVKAHEKRNAGMPGGFPHIDGEGGMTRAGGGQSKVHWFPTSCGASVAFTATLNLLAPLLWPLFLPPSLSFTTALKFFGPPFF